MIDGEAGPAILSQISAMQMDAMIDGDQITVVLTAACVADALRKGETPREIARGLRASLPSDDEWEDGLRERVEAALESLDERT